MGRLNDLKLQIEARIKVDGLDPTAIKGKIGLKSGKLFAFIHAGTPDDDDAIARLKQAAKEVLNISF